MIDFACGDDPRRYPANRSGITCRTLKTRVAVRRTQSASAGSVAFSREDVAMAKITGLCVGESLVGEGNEVAHIDLIMGPRGSAAESAFAHALTNNKDGFTSLLAVVAPNLLCKPATVLFNKVTIKGAKQAVQMFGPAQHAVAKAVADSVAEGVIPQDEADNLFICVGVFIHWDAADNKKIQEYNYQATKESIARAVRGEPKAAEVVAKRDQVKHPFAA
jgi:5,6,7,8-tetrahydromethanopterin hydro-lyase